VAVEAPRPAPVAVEPPKPAPAVEAPKPSAPAGEPVDPAMARAARKKAAVDGFLSTSDGAAAQPGNANAAPANQAAVTDNLKLAKLYMGIGSYDDAISRFREVIKLDPFNQDAIQGLVQAKKMKASASGK
jgi:tetratricopeptide (TPR) repeat protein